MKHLLLIKSSIDVKIVEDEFENGSVEQNDECYVFLVADENTPKPWRVYGMIHEPYGERRLNESLRISPSGNPADFASTRYNEVTSSMADRCYLFVEKGPGADTENCHIFLSDGCGRVTRIMVIQKPE